MHSLKTMIDRSDTDIVIIDGELPTGAECANANAKSVNGMAERASKPGVISDDVDRFTNHQGLAQVAAHIAVIAGAGPRGWRDQGRSIRSLRRVSAGYESSSSGFGARELEER